MSESSQAVYSVLTSIEFAGLREPSPQRAAGVWRRMCRNAVACVMLIALGCPGMVAQARTGGRPRTQEAGVGAAGSSRGTPASPSPNAAESPDGKRCAWVSEDGRSIWSATRFDRSGDWGQPDRLLTIRGIVGKIVFSPAGKSIAFENRRNQVGLRQIGGLPPATWGFIVLYDLEARKISYVDPSFGIDTNPVWSSDGNEVSFDRQLGHLPLEHLTRPVPRPQPGGWKPMVRPSESISLASLMEAPIVYVPQASADGHSIAYVTREATNRNIYFMRIGEPARRIVNLPGDDGQELADLAISKKGGAVAFVRGNIPNGQGDVPNPANSRNSPSQEVWITASDAAGPRFLGTGNGPQFTPDDRWVLWQSNDSIMGASLTWEGGRLVGVGAPEQFLAGELRQMRFSPDGQRIAYERNESIEIFDLTSRTASVVPHGGARDQYPAWSPDSRSIAYLHQVLAGSKQRGDRTQGTGGCDVYRYCTPAISAQPWAIWRVDVSDHRTRPVWTAHEGVGSVYYQLDQVYSPSQFGDQLFWSADDRIAFVWEGDGWRHLYSVPAGGGTETLLTPGKGEVETAAISLDRRRMFYTNNIGDIDHRHLASVDFKGTVRKTLTSGDESQWGPVPLADGRLAYVGGGWAVPPSVMVRDENGTTRPTGLPRLPASFPVGKLVKPQLVSFPASDGQMSSGYMIVPPHPTGCAIVFSHGGIRRAMVPGFHYLDIYSYFFEMNEYLASRGCVVLSVDHRSGIMHGEAFRNAPGWGFAENSESFDFVGGAKYLLARKDVDASRGVGIYGLSWGGYVTATALSRHSDIFKVGFDMAGVHAPIDEIERPHTALGNIATWNSPVLLVQGDDDRNVSFHDGIALTEAMKDKRPDVEFVSRVIPGETHDMYLTFEHLLGLYQEGSDFLISHLQGQPRR